MSTITPLPTAPSRNRPGVFSAEADTFLAALPPFVVQANVVAGEVEANAAQVSLDTARTLEYRDAAFAATHFAGNWADLTGPLNIPASVLHNSKLWMLTENTANVASIEPGVSALWFDVTLPNVGFAGVWADLTGAIATPAIVYHDEALWVLSTNLADITAHEPGISASWYRTTVGGAVEVSYSVNSTLGTTQLQNITATVEGLELTLPTLSKVREGGTALIIRNGGLHPFVVLSSSGEAICQLLTNAAVQVFLIDYLTQKILVSKDDFGEAERAFPSISSVFESASTDYISVTALSAEKAIVSYRDNSSAGYGTACVLSIAGTTITAGTPVVFENANTFQSSVTALSEEKAIVCYRDGGNSYYGTACILSISGTTITAGTPVVFESANTSYISVTSLSADKAIVCYTDGGNASRGTACILSISGTTITAGTPVVFESGSTDYISVTSLSADKAIVSYRDGGNASRGTACILSISGTTITAGTPVVFESASTPYISVTALSADKAIVCYTDGGNSYYGTACILSISGTTITAGTPAVFESASTTYISVTALFAEKAIVSYRDNGNASYGTACALSISGTTITAGTPAVFESASTTYISVTTLAADKAIVSYRDAGNANYGTANYLTVSWV